MKIMLLGLSLILLSGCAGQLVGKVPDIANDNYATVHIARPSGFAGCGVRMTIQIDYTDFYYLACGDYIAFRVPSGKPVTISQTTSTMSDHIDIDADKGKNYYFENDCNGWACWLHEARENRFKSIAQKCNGIIKVGFE